ncbi:hypothetical protein [Pseudonocardia humida]|uniref:PE-PGRS family protein n=1 Tax=Pseudonocardia humida TaxID=2800819 RepID=A0ABT1A0D3_9PSEU|nr:hypothetical protein [Pseudonocardia humida]MCO1656460.1 hypothetical protein [Pseudonocardia humida]
MAGGRGEGGSGLGGNGGGGGGGAGGSTTQDMTGTAVTCRRTAPDGPSITGDGRVVLTPAS